MLNLQNPLAPLIIGGGFAITINAGIVVIGTTAITIPQTVVALTPSASNFIFISPTGVLTVNTSGFVQGCLPICTIVTNSGGILTITDNRPDFTLPGGLGSSVSMGTLTLPVTNLKVISTANIINLPSGTTDLYTCPVGRKAIVLETTFTNPTGSGVTIQCFAQYKVNGVYTTYDFVSNAPAPGTIGSTSLLVPMLLNAGETFAVNANNTGLSLWSYIVEFDNTANIAVAKLATFSSGDNTLFTVPSNGLYLISNLEAVGAGSPLKGTIYYFNNSGVNRTVGINLVPAGGSTNVNNQIRSGTSVSSPSMLVTTFYGGLKQNDFININTDSNAAGQHAFIIYQLLP
jgi:hypothetical protein